MPLSWIDEALQKRAQDGLLRPRRTFGPRGAGGALISAPPKSLVNFASNDYLGLATDPRVVAAAEAAVRRWGFGAGASALVTGRTECHAALERNLSEFEAQEATVLFPSGYAANVGTIAALAERLDLLFCDRLNHSSLVEGCRLSGAALRVYRHDDLPALRRALERENGYRRRYIVTDAVFSMDGDRAPLPELCDIAERFDAELIVDEAHGTGVFGANGRGVCEESGVEHRVAVRIGTLSKALGSLGGFVSGPRNLIDWLWNHARTQFFSTALPAACCAAATAALEILRLEPERRTHLHANGMRLVAALRDGGLDIPEGSTGPIIPVPMSEPCRALNAARSLEENGWLVSAIRPPTVPRGTSRLRITVSAAHTIEQIDALAQACLRAVGLESAKVNP